jgi:hypothetical protein
MPNRSGCGSNAGNRGRGHLALGGALGFSQKLLLGARWELAALLL